MNWLRENWLWLSVVILFLWVHTKMHGRHVHGPGDESVTGGKRVPDRKEGAHDAH